MTELTPSPIYQPKWPVPRQVKALSTYRYSGFSHEPYDSFNLAQHVGDDQDRVEHNRQRLMQLAQLPEPPRWISQIHSSKVIKSDNWLNTIEADAIISTTPQHVCSILTADCLPVLMCDRQGNAVAAIHAGWRGLANGIIENTIAAFPAKAEDIFIWLGPAIGPSQFEVGLDVYRAFTDNDSSAKRAFSQRGDYHYLANIYLLAKQRIQQLGIQNIWGGDECTVSAPDKFFSYRRDNITGRMASLIWLEPE